MNVKVFLCISNAVVVFLFFLNNLNLFWCLLACLFVCWLVVIFLNGLTTLSVCQFSGVTIETGLRSLSNFRNTSLSNARYRTTDSRFEYFCIQKSLSLLFSLILSFRSFSCSFFSFNFFCHYSPVLFVFPFFCYSPPHLTLLTILLILLLLLLLLLLSVLNCYLCVCFLYSTLYSLLNIIILCVVMFVTHSPFVVIVFN